MIGTKYCGAPLMNYKLGVKYYRFYVIKKPLDEMNEFEMMHYYIMRDRNAKVISVDYLRRNYNDYILENVSDFKNVALLTLRKGKPKYD